MELMTASLCEICQEEPKRGRYNCCQRCRHKKERIPCGCGGTKRPGSNSCYTCWVTRQQGSSHNCWRGGRSQGADGYVKIYRPGHHRAMNGRYVREHILIMEEFIGRNLLPQETVHHKNGVRNDNRIENLELWSSRQPSGQRVEDKVKFALEILTTYAPERLS